MTSSGSFSGAERRTSSVAQNGTFKFPDLSQETLQLQDEHAIIDRQQSPSPGPFPVLSKLHSGERWQARRESGLNKNAWSNIRIQTGGHRHGRQKSLSEAIRTVRTRHGSVSQNAHEIAEALKAPVSGKLVVCKCCLRPDLFTKLIPIEDPVRRLVRHVYSIEHFLESHSHCFAQAHNSYDCTISLRLLLVYLWLMARTT